VSPINPPKHLEQRVRRAIESQPSVNKLVVVGGVAANAAIRSSLTGVADKYGWDIFIPPSRLCTDNGVMVAWAGIEKFKRGYSDEPRTQEVYARFPFKLRATEKV